MIQPLIEREERRLYEFSGLAMRVGQCLELMDAFCSCQWPKGKSMCIKVLVQWWRPVKGVNWASINTGCASLPRAQARSARASGCHVDAISIQTHYKPTPRLVFI